MLVDRLDGQRQCDVTARSDRVHHTALRVSTHGPDNIIRHNGVALAEMDRRVLILGTQVPVM